MGELNNFLKISDLSREKLVSILEKAGSFKKGEESAVLKGRSVAMLFWKPSTRTRVSFEVAVAKLGGYPIPLSIGDLQLSRHETVGDTAKVLSRYCDAIVARVFGHNVLEEMRENASVPVVNALSDKHHPCQALADLMTIIEFGKERGKVAYVGDGNNVCNSLMEGCALLGLNFVAACPKGYEPLKESVDFAKKAAKVNGSKLEITNKPKEAVKGADVIYTDLFLSMGEEKMKDKMKNFKGFQVNSALTALAKKDHIFLHCLPAHMGEEVTKEVLHGKNSKIFDLAENRMWTEMAVLAELHS